jgi:hypothetical protein
MITKTRPETVLDLVSSLEEYRDLIQRRSCESRLSDLTPAERVAWRLRRSQMAHLTLEKKQ